MTSVFGLKSGRKVSRRWKLFRPSRHAALFARFFVLQAGTPRCGHTGDLGNPSWTTLTNLTAALPVLTVTDTAAPANTNRFYRLMLNP